MCQHRVIIAPVEPFVNNGGLMRLRRRMVAELLAGLALAAAVITVVGEPPLARADCDGPYASFRDTAASARLVVVGDVVAIEPVEWMWPDGRSSRFTLRAWSVRDDTGPIDLPVRDVLSQPCAGYLPARIGDQVAIAFEGRAYSPQVTVNAIAWVGGSPPNLDGIETLTLAEVFQSIGRPVPATFPPAETPAPGSDFPWLPLVSVVAVVLVGGALLGRLLVRGES
jgi:hypothetical protein